MPDQKISADPLLATPSGTAALAGIDPGTDATKNYRFSLSSLQTWLNTSQYVTTTALTAAQVAAVPQFERSTTGALALTRTTHQGAEITLSATGATFSFSATTEGAGFTFLVRNRTGAALTVPTFTGGTREYALAAAHTQIKSAGNASVTVYSRNSTLYVEILGDTQ